MRKLMKLVGGAALMIGAVASGASTAQAERYNWSGLYFGGGAGYAWGDGLTDMSVSGVFVQRAAPDLNGGIWGGHVGLNYQMGAWVVGAEAQWLSGLDGSKLGPAFAPPSGLNLLK